MAQPKASTAPVGTAPALPKASAASTPEAVELSEAARSITLVRYLLITASIVLTKYPYAQPPPIVPLVTGVFNDPPPFQHIDPFTMEPISANLSDMEDVRFNALDCELSLTIVCRSFKKQSNFPAKTPVWTSQTMCARYHVFHSYPLMELQEPRSSL